jgi:hypothetical protein
MKRILNMLWKPWLEAAREGLDGMESLFPGLAGGALPLALLALTTLAGWFLYVPVHELMHALGCVATGGSVTELQIQPLYGGALLERVFPFVVAGGDYAGRLTGFDTGGSDLVFLATDAAPYALTVMGGFSLLRAGNRRRSPWLLGAGVVLLAAPLISLPGDYYEMGSILVSRLTGAGDLLRSDDLFALVGGFNERFPEGRAGWAGGVLLSALTGYLLACATLEASRLVANRLSPAAGTTKR